MFHIIEAFKLFFFSIMMLISYSVGYTQYGINKPIALSSDSAIVLIDWNSGEGLSRLSRSIYKNDFYQLAHHFQPQINPLYCGIATSVIVLNSMRLPKNVVPSQKLLEISKPKAWGGDTLRFPSYSQWTFLNEKTDKVKHRDIINLANITMQNTNDASQFDPGLTLAQLKGILDVYGLSVELYYANLELGKGIQLFRKHIKTVLKDNDHFLIVNFIGRAIGTTTGGHISPLSAYDEDTGSLLIFDVAGHKNPWYWVPIRNLYLAMQTRDGNNFRGWLIVSDTMQTSN